MNDGQRADWHRKWRRGEKDQAGHDAYTGGRERGPGSEEDTIMAGYYSYVTEQAIARQRREREAWEEQQREEREEQVRANTEARERYLAGLAAQKAEVAQRQAAETEAALAPAKERARRDFLLAHPGQDAATFEKVAWPLVRENLIADEEARVLEATKAQLRNNPMYSM